MLGLLTYVHCRDRLVDSRGIKLNEDDYVLTCNLHLGTIHVGSVALEPGRLGVTSLYTQHHVQLYWDNYIFKINKEWLNYLDGYYMTLLNNHIYKDDITEILHAREVNYKSSRRDATIRGLPICDYLFRPVKAGQFVYFFNQDKHDEMHCGIVISKTQVFTSDLEKKTIHSAYIVDNLNQGELEIQERIKTAYMNTVETKGRLNANTYRFGDVYKTSKFDYIYLGNCSIQIKQVKDSSSRWEIEGYVNGEQEFTLNYKEKLWLILPKAVGFNFDKCKDKDAFNFLLSRALETVDTTDSKYRVQDKFVVPYKSISGFKHLGTTGVKSGSYVGNLGLGESEFELKATVMGSVLQHYVVKLIIL